MDYSTVVILVVLLAVSVVAQPPVRICNSNSGCVPPQYCFINGTCTGTGICVTRPDVCPMYETLGGVCGCNRIRYGNPCLASAAGENYPTPIHPCNPIQDPTPPLGCADNSGCHTGQYCSKPLGQCSGYGTCTAKPQVCNMMATVDGLCGCDGQHWSSVCAAAVQGVNIKSVGSCSATVGCQDNRDCSLAQYCMKPTGQCGVVGRCIFKPLRCPLPPVSINSLQCGCDGRNYSISCEAARAGVNIHNPAPCPPPSGCSSDADCNRGFWCQHPVYSCDAPGQCVPKTVLNASCSPHSVCGCNGVTYSSIYGPFNAFVSIRNSGPCVLP